MLLRARDEPKKAALFRGALANIAVGAGMKPYDFERALALCEMTPAEYFRHERAVAMILNETQAPVRARLVEMTTEPNFAPDEVSAVEPWLGRIRAAGW